jgi:perosamine synthetase
LHLALSATGVGEGDEVITSPFSFIASANSIIYQRAKPVFVDIDPVTLNIDPAGVAEAITDRTTAILPVHIFGYPADMVAIERLGLPIVEDACEALGAKHEDGTFVGGRGHLSVFAFYANKQMTTGEGGMVVTADADLHAIIDSERNQGRAPNMAWLDHDRLGFNYRLSDIASAIGIVQVKRLDDLLSSRKRVANAYREALTELAAKHSLILPCEDQGGNERSWFVFAVQLPERVDRDLVIEQLSARGIPTKPYLPAIHTFSFYRELYGYKNGQFPICESVSARSLALPFFPQMEEWQIERVVEELRAVLEQGQA